MPVNIDFTDKVALITGATRGIGKAIAERFREAGARLILTGTNQKQIDELNDGVDRNIKPPIEFLHADFADSHSTESFLNKISNYTRIDVCVNNAGTNRNNLVGQTVTTDYDLLMDINLRAPFMICRELGQKMKHNGYGRIINIASIWSLVTKPGRSVYSMTKSGLIGLTRTMAVELASHNVLVNAVSPGFTITELTKKTLSKEDMDNLLSTIPAGRFAKPTEIADLVLFLSSAMNTYITGQNIVIDGGFTSV
jgi:3-oxoacyl-[acyl-carrier protein] reductase